MEKFTLKRPILYDGAELAVIDIDTSRFTAEHVREVCIAYNRLLRAKKIKALVSNDHGFAAYLAADTSGLPYSVITGLGAGDYTRLCNKVAALVAKAKGIPETVVC